MVYELLEGMDQDEFNDFRDWVTESYKEFRGDHYEEIKQVKGGVDRFSDEEVDKLTVSVLDAILIESEEPGQYVERLREYREDSEFEETIERVLDELVVDYFCF